MRSDHAEGDDSIDWLKPIVADAEAGFGGVLNAFELMKEMIEAGAAGVHFEDQLSSAKKCGHMGGKVLVPTQECDQQAGRRRAWRPTSATCRPCCVARTDAEGANLLTSDVDERDRPFIDPASGRTAEGFFCVNGRPRAGDRARPRLRAVRRPGVVRDRQAGPRGGARSSPRRMHRSFPASCWPTTARRRSTGSASSTTPRSPNSSASWRRWATSSSSSRWPASTR